MADKKQEQGWIRARLPIFVQMTIAVAILSTAYQHVSTTPYKFPTVNTLERRVAFTLRCLVVSIVPLVVALGTVALTRFSTRAIDPLSGNEQVVQIPSKILQNTLEQFVLHSFILLSLATIVDENTTKFIPFLAALFVFARFLFIIGYHIHVKARATGFLLTFIPTVATLGTVLNLLYQRGIATF